MHGLFPCHSGIQQCGENQSGYDDRSGPRPTRRCNVLDRAVAKGPTVARQFHLAMSLIKNGDKTRGMELLNAAPAKDP